MRNQTSYTSLRNSPEFAKLNLHYLNQSSFDDKVYFAGEIYFIDIKEEFLNEFIFLNFNEAKSVTAKSIRNYNQKRPHASLNYFTPEKAHGLSGGLRKIWKNNKKRPKKKNSEAIL